jgi:hypothetical protein
MNIALVPVSQLMSVVPALMPYLEESAKWTRGRAIVEDIVRFLLNGQMHLWAVHKDNVVYGHVIGEVKPYPQCKMLTVQYCAGEPHHMQYVEDEMFAVLEEAAKSAGCAGIEFVGRPGWRKAATSHGFEVQSVMYQKFFEVAK